MPSVRILRRESGCGEKGKKDKVSQRLIGLWPKKMKTPNDPRHQKRITRMQRLFSHSFGSADSADITPILKHLPTIDQYIQIAAPEWPIEKIAKIDLSILRLAVWELEFEKKNPPKVIIDEAVELGKSYGNDHSAKFINGVLGTIMKKYDTH